jgi:iron transport multicopper oxidase
MLGGYSFGGAIAFETASQLRARGVSVDRLLLIDTPLFETADPLAAEEPEEIDLMKELFDMSMASREPPVPPHARDDFVQARPDVQRRLLLDLMRLPALSPASILDNVLKSYRAHRAAMRNYRPGACDVRVRLLLPADGLLRAPPPFLNAGQRNRFRPHGWEELCGDRLVSACVPGDHFSVMRSPQVHALADSILSHIDGCCRDG